MALAEEVTFQPLRDLHADSRNPRLRHEQRGKLKGDDLLVFIERSFEPVTVAESIARHGFFGSEPLVICHEEDEWVVLEGNRRLVALLGLARPELRERFDDAAKWDELARRREISLNMAVPVIVADKRTDADAVIGFRHIAGVVDWKPLQRAQFIAYLVDDQDKSFLEVADTVGEEEPVVRMLYRNQSILGRARQLGRDDLADAAERRFGTYTAALNRTGIREFIGARAVGDVQERTTQLDDEKLPELAELSSWLYGSGDGEKVIAETRDLTALAEVLRAGPALEELRRTRDLSAAYALTPGPPKRLVRQLAVAVGHLRAVANSAELIVGEAKTEELVEELRYLTDQITSAVEGDGDEVA